jgi:hypothetical protein
MQAKAQKQDNTTVRLHGNHSDSNNLTGPTSMSSNHGRELLLARTEDGDIYQTEARAEKNQRPSLKSSWLQHDLSYLKRSYHKHIVKHDVVIADKNLYTMNEYSRSTEQANRGERDRKLTQTLKRF